MSSTILYLSPSSLPLSPLERLSLVCTTVVARPVPLLPTGALQSILHHRAMMISKKNLIMPHVTPHLTSPLLLYPSTLPFPIPHLKHYCLFALSIKANSRGHPIESWIFHPSFSPTLSATALTLWPATSPFQALICALLSPDEQPFHRLLLCLGCSYVSLIA